MTPAAAVALAGALSLAALGVGWLSRGGALAATVIGGIVFAGGGVAAGALLALFFVSGSALTYAGRRRRAALDLRERGGRHAWQVVTNGSWAAVGGVLVAAQRDPGWAVLVGALAAAQADTWATEIGQFAPQPPRLITSGRPVPVGTSGAVSPLGTTGGVAGAGLMAGLAWTLGVPAGVATAAIAGGIAGMTLDSVLGATVQSIRHCDACGAETEHATHTCGRPARQLRGWRWLDNHGVNLVATGVGAVSSAALASW